MSMTSTVTNDVTPDDNDESFASLPVGVGNFELDDVTVDASTTDVTSNANDDVSIVSEATDAMSMSSFAESSPVAPPRSASPLKSDKPKSRSLPRGMTPPPTPPVRSDSERKQASRYASRSQETLLSGDSGFSQLSHATTPSNTSASQELLDSEVETSGGRGGVSEGDVAPQTDRSTPELQEEIDSALAEITHGLQTLEKQQKLKRDGVSPAPRATATVASGAADTPDLVLGLPVGSAQSPATSPKDRVAGESAAISTAEVFANSNQSTMKKTGSKSATPVTSSVAIESGDSTGSVPPVLAQPPSSVAMARDEVIMLSRTASARHKPKAAKRTDRHLSDPEVTSHVQHEPPPPMFQPRVVHHVDSPRSKPEAPSPLREVTPPKVAPKPALKVKPPTMRKTFKSPEVWKKLGMPQPTNTTATTTTTTATSKEPTQ